jgi:hypothetical protein
MTRDAPGALELAWAVRRATIAPIPYRRAWYAGPTCNLTGADAFSEQHQDKINFTLRPHVARLDDRSDAQ